LRPIHLFAAALLIATLFADGGTAQQSEHLRFAFVTHGGPGNPFWIAADVDGLAVTCPDPDAIRENVARARAAGIPVVLNTADPGAGTEQALPTLFYIGASEFLGARRMHARSWQLLQRRASRHASQVFTAFSNRRVSSSMV
jgi:ABC-type sugar transport system substrate-binding protein